MQRFLVTLLIFAAGAFAQTKPGIDQLKGKPGQAVQLWAVKTDGSLAQIKLGSGLLVTQDPTTGQLILSIDPAAITPAPSTTTRVFSEGATMALSSPDVWNLQAAPIAGTAEVYANGIHQKPGFDYDLAGAAITFRKLCVDLAGNPATCIGSNPTIVVSYSK